MERVRSLQNTGRYPLSTGLFLVFIGVGAALNAVWFDVRFPTLAPRDLRIGVVHLIASSVLANTAVPFAFDVSRDTPFAALVTVFGVAFPVLAYLFLSGFWLLKLAHGMLAGHLR